MIFARSLPGISLIAPSHQYESATMRSAGFLKLRPAPERLMTPLLEASGDVTLSKDLPVRPTPPYVLGTAVEHGPSGRASTRIVVFADSDFASNSWVQHGDNARIFLDAVKWTSRSRIDHVPTGLAFQHSDARGSAHLMGVVAQWALAGFWLAAAFFVWSHRRRR